jgi:flagellar protein FlaG
MWFANEGAVAAVAAPRGEAAPVKQSEVELHQPTVAELENAVRDMNSAMHANQSNLAFSVDQDTQQTVVSVTDSQTGEVIKQFPSKEAIAIAKAIGNIQQGLLLKQRA